MTLDARLAAAHARLNSALSLGGEAVLTCAAGQVKALIDWQPRPDKLQVFAFDTGAQVVIVTVDKSVLSAPKTGQSLSSATDVFTIGYPQNAGHVWELYCTVSKKP